ncbi:MAG: hypothetical protein JWN52_2699 [Actinomycetia bacterium]|jgi:hypothetical protein|nr:hypothetical protein [Actinomycetes bacterium]
MMSLLLVLACLTVGAAELYLARGSNQKARQLTELGALVTQQERRLESLTSQLGATIPALQRRLSDLDRLSADMLQAKTRLAQLGDQTATFSRRLTALEDARDFGQDLNQRITRTLEALEQNLANVLRYTIGQLDQAVAATLGGGDPGAGTVSGGLSGMDATHRPALSRAYELCSRTNGLVIRFRVPLKTSSWHVRFYLTGKSPRELEGGFLSLLDSVRSQPASPGEATFQGLLLTLNDSGPGFTQIGPMVAVRTPDALLCGVLTLTELRRFDAERIVGDPTAVAVRLRTLPAERVRDLSTWPARRARNGHS